LTAPSPAVSGSSAFASEFHEEVATINLSKSSTNRFDTVKALVAQLLGITAEDVYAAAAKARTNNLNVRLQQTEGSEQIALAFIKSADEVDYAVEIAKRFAGPSRRFGAVAICAPDPAGIWEIRAVVEPTDSTFAAAIQGEFPNAKRVIVADLGIGTLPTRNSGASNVVDPIAAIPVQVDPRIKRMIRLALRTYKVVVLVGPPGTGKTQLLEEIVEEIRGNHAGFGFAAAPHRLMRRTPEESWTARELVGGETVDDKGRLRFRPGAVLDAIGTDRWLLLDELNRADMDKIFGPLMTWLSGQNVELGRAGTGLRSPTVELAWSSQAHSSVERVENLAATETEPDTAAHSNLATGASTIGATAHATQSSEPVRFLAGRDWRLLGTYNPFDAQRVFRFGQALGRRMKEIPIPAATPTQFAAVLNLRSPSLTTSIRSAIEALYSAHYEDPATQLGPAIFLEMANYVLNGLGSEFLGGLDENLAESIEEASSGTQVANALDGEVTELAVAGEGASDPSIVVQTNVGAPTSPAASDSNIPADESVAFGLLAEAYLINPGKYAAKYTLKTLGPLGTRIVDSGGLPEAEWTWIKKQLPGLA
jgi:hypothetical protein